MSSTIDRLHRLFQGSRGSGERGQVLVVLAGGLVMIIAVAALVFDTGQSLVDRRTQQNAADAASLAGARYLPTATGAYQGTCAARTSGQLADPALKHVNAACDTAEAYLNAEGLTNRTITVKVPPGPETQWSLQPDNIEVKIDSTRPSIFAGILGAATQHTGALAVAQNSTGYSLPYSLLALNPCGTSTVSGGGGISVNGDVQVDSSCNPALKISGGGTLDSPECNTVGTSQVTNGGTGCTVMNSGMQASGDPLSGMPPPAVPANLGIVSKAQGETKNVPNGCPAGQATSTITTFPGACQFNSSFDGHSYHLSPGYYPGGLKLNAGTFYMEPGLFYIGGGGLDQGGNGATLISVDAGTQTFGGGVLLYNGNFHIASFCSGGTTTGCAGPMGFNGSTAIVKLKPIQTGPYTNMVIFGERTVATDITLNGSATNLDISGTIYAPHSSLTVNGSGATSLAVQLIAYDFKVTGSGGRLTITYDSGAVFQLKGVGLVQ